MPQKTNLNINPYFDDFDSSNDYYKVLFKPGVPVQSRELTTLQSIFQNQIETFGTHFFKEGSVVIPGSIQYNDEFNCVKLNATQFGTDVSLYADKLVGKTIVGQTTGISAKVVKVVLPSESDDVEYITLYISYRDSGNDFEFSTFSDAELLSSDQNIVYGNTTISSGTPFASLIGINANAVGSSVSITKGVYFIRGSFVNVDEQTIILDYYNNRSKYRVGFSINETIVDAKEDNSLFDNARGFSNYASPGADRLKIELTLSKKDLTDFNDSNFVEILKVDDGEIKKISTRTEYNLIKDYIAKRTFDESGNYSVEPFEFQFKNSLNDRIDSRGIYFDNELTSDGNVPSDDLACLQISTGKAYVKGFDINKDTQTIVDIEKPRETKEVKNTTVPFEMGNLLRVNKVTGLAEVKKTIELYSQFETAGPQIGEARVYTFSLTDARYEGDTTSWDLRLYDIQTYTKLTLNQSVDSDDIKESFYVKGKSSGASGFATASGSSDIIYLRQTSGTFIKGEQIIVNGNDISRIVQDVHVYDTQSIKSVKQTTPFSFTQNFTANCILEKLPLPLGIREVNISAASAGVSTVTSSLQSFTGITTDTIIRYQLPGISTAVFNRVNAVSTDNTSIEVVGITSVTGVFEGSLPTSDQIVDAFVGAPFIRGDSKLYAQLSEDNVSDLNLSDSSIIITEQLTGNTTTADGTLSLNITTLGISSASWATFDQERYSIGYDDANNGIGTITADTFSIVGNTVRFNGLTPSKNVTVNVTATKDGIRSKIKNSTRSTVISVNNSKLKESGTTDNDSSNDGLTFNSYYGLRVQDEEISLNHPDVYNVLSVYESLNSENPTLDQIEFNSIANVSSNAIIGENIIGRNSKAVARVVTNSTTTPSSSSNKLGVVYLTRNKLNVNETVDFLESNIETEVESITFGNYKDITSVFSLDKGQNDQYYGYSKIVRNRGKFVPSKRLLIVFDRYTTSSTDSGDVFTVNSYDEEMYGKYIPEIGKGLIRASDTLDFRPKVSVFDPTVTTDRSPFDFNTRTTAFDTLPTKLLAPGEGSTVDFSFYLGRIDRIYLSRLGEFFLERGVSAKTPIPPVRLNNDEFLELGTVNLPAYLYSPDNVTFRLEDNRRYTMRDIGNIEDRVENLERYTTLSLLELDVKSLEIQDFEGRNRFKSGFFVDNFSNYEKIDSLNSILQVNLDENFTNQMEPLRQRTSVALQVAPKEDKTPESLDLSQNFELLDPNVQKTGNLITLKYEEVDWLEQPFATQVENVNPFSVISYSGSVQLNPNTDVYVRTIQLDDNVIRRTVNRTLRRTGRRRVVIQTDVSTVSRNNLLSVSDDIFMRSRNTQFTASNLKPYTRYYQFLDGNGGFDFIPKLIEIADTPELINSGASAAYSIGETVIGTVDGVERIRFRLASPSHKFGAFDNPEEFFDTNPYERSTTIGSFYSANSKVLNVDIPALVAEAQGTYFGYLEVGMQLVGQTSGAISYVKDLRLISDSFGDLIGSFFIRDPNTTPAPANVLEVGESTFTLNSSSSNQDVVPGSTVISSAESEFLCEGILETYQREVIITTTNTTIRFVPPPPNPPDPPRRSTPNIRRFPNAAAARRFAAQQARMRGLRRDPLAQTFTVGGDIKVPGDINIEEDSNGVFVTSVDLFFNTIDESNTPLQIEIRTVELGIPTLQRVGKPVILRPRSVDSDLNVVTNINVSPIGDVATNVKFPEPIYLEGNTEYALVIISEYSNDYELWTAVMGETTIETANLPDTGKVRFSQQFALGSLYKSQNGSVWTTNQYQDLKFKLYKAKFTSNSGTAYFYNPPLDISNSLVDKLQSDSIRTLPKTGKIGITTVTDSEILGILTAGRKLAGVANNNGTAVITGTGSSVTTVGISTGGINYPVSLSDKSVDTFNVLGRGTGLKLLINTNASGIVTGVGIDTGYYGSGYQTGDVVGIVTSTTSSTNPTGRESLISITGITGANMLYVTNVQGEFGSSGSGKEFAVGAALSYYSGSTGDTIVSMASTTIVSSSGDGGVNSGNYMKVNHFNHGMYSNVNKLKFENIESDVPPTLLNAELSSTETSFITVTDTSNFTTFEGQSVTAGYPGYLKIGREIISYNFVGTGVGQLNIVSRGVDSTIKTTHPLNSQVYKHELSGISLRRINNIVTNTSSNADIDMDSYFVEIDRSATYGSLRSADGESNTSQLSFNGEKNVGGSEIRASKNIVFDSITPFFDCQTPNLTSVSSLIRTVSGTSVGGNEISFVDKGFESVEINQSNIFTDLRMICSEENQNEYLTQLPRFKSFTAGVTLNTDNENISPYLNIERTIAEFSNSRLNNPIENYASDNRVNSISEDPHSAVYYSNRVVLKQPATTLKVILSAYRHESADFRVLYSLSRSDSNEVEQSFELFPGYDNLISTTSGFEVVDPSKNSGLPDVRVPASIKNQFLEYEFTAENLDLFNEFSIKIVMSGTNQAEPPRFKDLRIIAVR